MYGFTYTTQGAMTPADLADLADLYDWNCGLGDEEPKYEEYKWYGCDAEVAERVPCRRDEFGTCRDAGRIPHECD